MSKKRKPEEQKVATTRTLKASVTTKTITVKCSLKSILRADLAPELMQLFSDYVYRISNMSVEASKLINLYILWRLESKPDEPMAKLDQTFIDNSFILVSWIKFEKETKKSDTVKELEEVFEKYYKPCRPGDIEPIYRNDLAFFRSSAREQLQTNARNHMMTNFYERTMEWIKLKIELEMKISLTMKQINELAKLIYSLSTKFEEAERKILKDKILMLEKENKEAFTKNYCNSSAVEWACNFADENLDFFKKYEMEKPADYNLGHINKWYKYLPWFYRILVDFEKLHKLHQECKSAKEKSILPSLKRRRLFTLFPEHNTRPLHLALDNTTVKGMSVTIHSLLAKSVERNGGVWPKPREKTTEEIICSMYNLHRDDWSRIFDMDKFPKSGNSSKFAYFMRTDGINASLLFEKKKTNLITRDGEAKLPIAKAGQRIVAIDPGRKNLFFGVDNQGETLRCSAKKYYTLAGFKRRLKKQKKWSNDTPEIGNFINNMPISKTSSLEIYQKHLKYILSGLRNIMKFFCHNRQKRLRFISYIRQQKTLDGLCREITGGRRDTIILYGDGSFSGTAKGHCATPNKLFKKRLQAHCDNVVMIDEYRTSKACHNCKESGYIELRGPLHRQITWKVRKKDGTIKKICRRISVEAKVSPKLPKEAEDVKDNKFSVHGLRVCPNCHKTLNRDRNAANNIMDVYDHQINDSSDKNAERPLHLLRVEAKTSKI